jgi:hypothetical protein
VDLPFTHKPGRRERDLRRRHGNPLFAWPPIEVSPETLLAAQKADHEELEAFREAFHKQVKKAVDLQPDAGSEVVLALKEELEKLYEQTCGLAESQEREKAALSRLIGLIGKAVRRAAGNDPLAHKELQDEDQAQAIHFRLLEQALVADILHPQSPIGPGDLVPTLLSADDRELDVALEVFSPEQLALLVAQGGDLLDRLESERVDTDRARRRLARMEQQLLAGNTRPTST